MLPRIISVILLLTGILVVEAASAAAQPTCTPEWYCAYEAVDYGPRQCAFYYSNENYNRDHTCSNGGRANDIITSYQNAGTGTYSCLISYANAHYGYELWRALSIYDPYDPDAYGPARMKYVGSYENDKASSHSWYSCV